MGDDLDASDWETIQAELIDAANLAEMLSGADLIGALIRDREEAEGRS